MKNDLISKKDLLAYFFRPYSNEEIYTNIDIERVVAGLPVSTPGSDKPMLGHWILRSDHIQCSNCGEWYLQVHLRKKNYCPNCGAKMKREIKE